MKTAYCFTTIRDPTDFVESHVENLKKYGHGEDVTFLIVLDKKTPVSWVGRLCEYVAGSGFSIECVKVEEQEQWLDRYPELTRYIPWNSPLRRNLAFLKAVEDKYDLVISLDDDNFAGEDDFLEYHSIVGRVFSTIPLKNEGRWFNPCAMLYFNYDVPVFMRGFPYCKRGTSSSFGRFWDERTDDRIVLNMGLWTDKPDVDAVTNLSLPSLESTGIRRDLRQEKLPEKCFMPINTQNTAFLREVAPAFFCVPYGTIHGLYCGRYDDVWGGLFAQKVIQHMGVRVTVGRPLTIHKRNLHNILDDLSKEYWGMMLTEDLVKAVESIELDGKTYADSYIDLAKKLERRFAEHSDIEIRRYLRMIFNSMIVWAETTRDLV